MKISADEVEFLSAKGEDEGRGMAQEPSADEGFTEVSGEDLPF